MIVKRSPRESCIAGMENSGITHMGVCVEGGGLQDRDHLENNKLLDILMGLNMWEIALKAFLESSGLFLKEQYFLENSTNSKMGQPIISERLKLFYGCLLVYMGSLGSDGKYSTAMRGTQFQSLDQEDPLEKEMATNSSILAQRILWTEEPGELWFIGSQKVRQD